MALVIDEADPCAAAATLRAVYREMIAGKAAITVSFSSGPSGVSRSATYQPGNAAALLAEIRSFEQRCAIAQGERPKRFALRAGGM